LTIIEPSLIPPPGSLTNGGRLTGGCGYLPLEAVSRGEYVVDGHDVGSGTLNVFIYAEDSKVNSAITLVIRFFEQGKLPTGMRIGRAIYADEQRKNWRF
jgi:hypothetical protein